MFIKKVGLLASVTAFSLVTVLPPASAVGRKTISAIAAKSGVKVPVTSQGVAITVPGEEISFIQLSHLSKITCTTDNGNMCAGSSGSANILYVRSTNIYFQDQRTSPDGSTLLLIKTNGPTCSALCQLQLIPSSSVPPFTVLEIGGVDPSPPVRRTPVAARPIPLSPNPSPKVVPSDIRVVPSQVKIDLLEPQGQIIPQVLPEKAPTQAVILPTPSPVPTPLALPVPIKKVSKKPKATVKVLSPIAVQQSLLPSKKLVVYTPPKTELGSRAIANLLVRGLLVANRNREIGFNSSMRSRVQDLVRNLRKDLPLATAQKRANVPETVVKRLMQLGSKR
jgi:hypothetical protein